MAGDCALCVVERCRSGHGSVLVGTVGVALERGRAYRLGLAAAASRVLSAVTTGPGQAVAKPNGRIVLLQSPDSAESRFSYRPLNHPKDPDRKISCSARVGAGGSQILWLFGVAICIHSLLIAFNSVVTSDRNPLRYDVPTRKALVIAEDPRRSSCGARVVAG